MIAALFPGLVTWLYFDVFPGTTATAVLYSANKVVQVVFPLFWLAVVLREPAWSAFRKSLRLERAGLVAGAAFGLAAIAVMLGFYYAYFRDSRLLAGVPGTLFAKMGELGIASPVKFIAFGLFLILLNSALEEYYWRWFLFGRLRGLMPAWAAVILSAVAFSLHHAIALASFIQPGHSLTTALVFSAGVGMGGAAWAWIYHKTGSLTGAWLSHLLCDVPVIIIGLDFVRGCWRT